MQAGTVTSAGSTLPEFPTSPPAGEGSKALDFIHH